MGLELRKRLFAKLYARVTGGYDERMADLKRALFRGLEGTVVEIGPGTGANLAHAPRGLRWIGIEPNRHMHAALLAKARELGIDVDVRELSGERLPLGDGEADAVISTLVLCSVKDPDAVLAEVRRVLRPGGTFAFLEHVGAPRGTRLRRVQSLLTPLWRLYADGCRLDRDTGESIRRAGFGRVELREFDGPREVCPRIVVPHVSGRATR